MVMTSGPRGCVAGAVAGAVAEVVAGALPEGVGWARTTTTAARTDAAAPINRGFRFRMFVLASRGELSAVWRSSRRSADRSDEGGPARSRHPPPRWAAVHTP